MAFQNDYLHKVRKIVADDSFCCTFQSVGQYRAALIKEIDHAIGKLEEAEEKEYEYQNSFDKRLADSMS